MRKLVMILVVFAISLAALPASAARCKHKADREARAPGEGVEVVEIYARAGDLRVVGKSDLTEMRAEADLCTSKEAMLAESEIVIRRDGARAQIIAEMPDTSGESDGPWSGQAAIMDMDIELPAGVSVIVYDSSGDMKVKGLAAAEITDSSGGIDVSDIGGAVVIPKDSSGDIEMRRVGEVTIQIDSSGDIWIEDAASVTIANDTSGEIVLRDIGGDVLIGNDSSGRISVRGVAGNFIVENDTSGDIRHEQVEGSVSLPEHRQGT
jgi:hypothetical protein